MPFFLNLPPTIHPFPPLYVVTEPLFELPESNNNFFKKEKKKEFY